MSTLPTLLPVASAEMLPDTIPIPEGPNLLELFTVSWRPYVFVALLLVAVVVLALMVRGGSLGGWQALTIVAACLVFATLRTQFSYVPMEQRELSVAAIEEGYNVSFLSGAGAVPVDEGTSSSAVLLVDGTVRDCTITATSQGSFLVRCAAGEARMEVLTPQ